MRPLALLVGVHLVELTTHVLPELFAAWGFPPVLDTSLVGAGHPLPSLTTIG